MKNNKGITLISLIVTVVIIIIIATISISVSIGNEGIFTIMMQSKEDFEDKTSRQENKINDLYKQIQSGTIGTVKAGETATGGNKAYTSSTGSLVIVPQGFAISGLEEEQSVENGLVIYETNGEEVTDWEYAKILYNQYVWVPVSNASDMYTENSNGVALTGNTGIKTNFYSKTATLGSKTITRVTPGDTSGIREPDLVLGNGNEYDAQNYSSAGFSSLSQMGQSLASDYEEMINSVKIYGGFFVGRYELTGTTEMPLEKMGSTLTNANWYNLYKTCKILGANNDNIETRMIWGCQWDAICKFIEPNLVKQGYSLDDSRAYGNYQNAIEPANVSGYGTKQDTGSCEYWKTNNIYDLAGNCWEWTQDASWNVSNSFYIRLERGPGYNINGSERPVNSIGSDSPTYSDNVLTTRPVLYVKSQDKSSLGRLKDAGTFTSKKTTVLDNSGNTVIIPEGFKIASDSALERADGIVIEDKDGNQFVWIPVDNISNYKRTAFSTNVMTNELDSTTNSYKINLSSSDKDYYTETMPTDEQTSVNTNKGYYIGRFEAGDSTIQTASGSSLRTGGTSQENAVAIKKGYAPYNYISKTNSQKLAESMDTVQGYSATTKLCSSYAWDTAINFIQNKISDYGNNLQYGNNLRTVFTYKDITGNTQTKGYNESVLVPTGQTSPACNIYDIGGNIWEWTTETSSKSDCTNVCRGGSYNFSNYPAGMRDSDPDVAITNVGFRVTLFL